MFFLFMFVSMDWAFICTAFVDSQLIIYQYKPEIIYQIWNHLIDYISRSFPYFFFDQEKKKMKSILLKFFFFIKSKTCIQTIANES